VPADDIAVVLRDNFKRQLKAANESYNVRVSAGTEYCTTENDVDRRNNVILWVGSFDSFDDATDVSFKLKSEGVCADCFPTR